MISGVYKITNAVNDKFYVGSSINVKQRISAHKSYLRAGTHKNDYLQNAYNKYHECNFNFEVLEFCEIEKLLEREQFYLDMLKPQYNICKLAGHTLGYRHLPENIEKAQRNRKPPRDFKLSASHKEAILKSIVGKPKSDEHKAKLAAVNLGKTLSKETKIKLCIARRKRIFSQETKDKMRKSLKGVNRKITKWPCADGWKCKCRDCKDKRNKLNEFYKMKSEQNASL